jgi:[protein-PII] uridylyltransferase
MSRLGLIGWLLPDYARIVGKMQYDMYHVYTVDYHTLKAVSVMHSVCEGGLEEALPLSTRLMNEVADRKILYMAIFLHDIAKGRGGDHSELGADVARQVCPLFGFDSDDTELVAWLVAQHLTMSFYAFKRDSHDPETIIHFAHVVGTVERLRYLLIVTAVDMRATNPSLLSSWKAELLRELYFATENLLTGGLLTFGREAATATSIAKLSSWAAEANPAAAALVERWPEAYWLSTSYAQQQEHLQRLYRHHTQSAQVSIHANTMTDKDVTELTIISPDTAGLFARIARYLTQQQVSIVDARLYTLRDGTVYDLVQVQSQGKALWPDHAARLAERLQGILSKPVSVAKPPATRGNAALQVAIDNKSSADYTIIEVTGDDRVGLLADLAECLHALGLSINRARIATFAGRAVDVFYVCTLSGEKVLDKEALSTIKTALAEVR